MTSTIDGLRQQLQQLQSRHERGELDAEALAAARAPLERELVALVVAGDASAVPPSTAPAAAPASAPVRPSRRLQAGLAGSVLVLAVIGYALTGSPGAAGLGAPPHAAAGLAEAASAEGQQVTAEQIVEMVDKLAQRLKEKPDDAVGWTMLARSYTAMNRFADAVPAYQKALALAGDDANLLADYADALAATQNGKLAGEPAQLIQRALARDPRHVKALALAGSAAFEVQLDSDTGSIVTPVTKWYSPKFTFSRKSTSCVLMAPFLSASRLLFCTANTFSRASFGFDARIFR